MTKTEAIIFDRESSVIVGTIDMPDPGPNEVQIKTQYSFISTGTERWALTQKFTWRNTPFPCVPGYQRAGEIIKLGPGVNQFQVGDRVFATSGSWEGNVKPFWGSHVSIANTKADETFHIPQNVTSKDASAAVVAQVGYNAASRMKMDDKDWILVYGDGVIGQFAAQAARAKGAKVILVGHRDARLDIAKGCSADHVINSHTEHVAERVRHFTGQSGVKVVLDTVQKEQVQKEYLELFDSKVHPRQIVYCGHTPGKVWADMGLLQQREMTCHFVAGWNRNRIMNTFQSMSEGELHVSPLITHESSYKEAPYLYEMVLKNTEANLGLVLNWN